VEVKGIALEGRKLGSDEGSDKIGAANRLAMVTSPGGKLGIRGKNGEGWRRY
jgi:hypothetical protein